MYNALQDKNAAAFWSKFSRLHTFAFLDVAAHVIEYIVQSTSSFAGGSGSPTIMSAAGSTTHPLPHVLAGGGRQPRSTYLGGHQPFIDGGQVGYGIYLFDRFDFHLKLARLLRHRALGLSANFTCPLRISRCGLSLLDCAHLRFYRFSHDRFDRIPACRAQLRQQAMKPISVLARAIARICRANRPARCERTEKASLKTRLARSSSIISDYRLP